MPQTAEHGKKRQKKLSKRARHRLLSIHYDVEHFVRPTLRHPSLRHFPVFANERCGSWYAHPLEVSTTNTTNCDAAASAASCYFKSTDGHTGTWNFSLKRLNLNIVRAVAEHGGCVILDASASKELPDSFSRTIPIWAAVLNRMASRYRSELGITLPPNSDGCPRSNDCWDEELHTPGFCVSQEEHSEMLGILEARVETLYSSRAIVDPHWLASTLTRPLRAFFITPQHWEAPSVEVSSASHDFFPLFCVNCSQHDIDKVTDKNCNFIYTQGAADDHESWARHLSPRLFWYDNLDRFLAIKEDDDAEDMTDSLIDSIIQQELKANDSFEVMELETSGARLFDFIGNTSVAIGTRRAGRPPDCWNKFDAILNVTDMEYSKIAIEKSNKNFYLQLPVKEGKRDRSELERWMAVGAVFVWFHAQQKRRILIHCAQGKDRSVAMGMCVVALFCDLTYPLQWKENAFNLSINDLAPPRNGNENVPLYQCSGLSQQLVDLLLERNGRDALLDWVRKGLYRETSQIHDNEPLATKDSLRIALLLIQQDREKADPTRSTMQKLNRFFMSPTTNIHT